MSFIETLRSIGGVKPCPDCCNEDGTARFPCGVGKYINRVNESRECASCHGTGQIIDLAPLLAKPSYLEDTVRILI